MRGVRILLVTVFFAIVSGCYAPRSYVSMEILQPADVTFPGEVRRVAYLNRSPLSTKNLASQNTRGISLRELRIIDTMVCNALKTGFTDGFESESVSYTDTVFFLEQRRYDTVGRSSNITRENLQKVLSTFPVDAVITQDYYFISLGENVRYDFAGFYYGQDYILNIEVLWKAYAGTDTIPFDTYRLIDTLYFSNRSDMSPSSYYTATDAVRIGAYEVAYAFAQRNVPSWREINRFIFKGFEQPLKEAGELTGQGNWEQAREIWMASLQDEDRKLRARAAYNLGVYYELEDDLDQALEFLDIAVSAWEGDEIVRYRSALIERIKEKEKVLEQVK